MSGRGTGRALRPGEIRIGPPLPSGHDTYERINERGDIERGYLADVNEPMHESAAGYIECGEETEPGIRRVVSFHRFTARGPAQVSSASYRDGWDEVFSLPEVGARSKPSRPS